MTRILFIHDYPLQEGGGIELQTYEDAKELSARGFSVSIVSSRTSSETLTDTRKNYPLITREGVFLDVAADEDALLSHISRSDIVHIQATFSLRGAMMAGMGVCKTLSKPFFVTLHTNIGHVPFSALQGLPLCERETELERLRECLKDPLCTVIGVSHSIKETLQALSLPKPFEVVHNAKCWDSFGKGTCAPTSSATDILYVGEISWMKGMHVLLSACTLLVKSVPDARITFIGDGQNKKDVASLIESLGLSKNVTLLPYTRNGELAAHLSNTRLLVQPSLTETWGNIVAEAMSLDVPVVVSATEGLVELVGNGRFGTLFERGDALDLSKKLEALVPLLREKPLRSAGTSSYIRSTFSVQRRMQELLKAYEKGMVPCPVLYSRP